MIIETVMHFLGIRYGSSVYVDWGNVVRTIFV